jgi:hypothetical protein
MKITTENYVNFDYITIFKLDLMYLCGSVLLLTFGILMPAKLQELLRSGYSLNISKLDNPKSLERHQASFLRHDKMQL